MIVTENAVYLHQFKTGGTWMRDVLNPIVLYEQAHAIPTRPLSKPVFVVVRNPWAWYVSMYNFLFHGSNIMPANKFDDPLLKAFGHAPTFSLFIKTLCSPPADFKVKLRNYVRIQKLTDKLSTAPRGKHSDPLYIPQSSSIMTEHWLDNNKSFYQNQCDLFMQYATDIGKTETLKTDLTLMLNKVGDLTREVNYLLDTHPSANVGLAVEYRDFYDAELLDIIAEHHTDIISKFSYKV